MDDSLDFVNLFCLGFLEFLRLRTEPCSVPSLACIVQMEFRKQAKREVEA